MHSILPALALLAVAGGTGLARVQNSSPFRALEYGSWMFPDAAVRLVFTATGTFQNRGEVLISAQREWVDPALPEQSGHPGDAAEDEDHPGGE